MCDAIITAQWINGVPNSPGGWISIMENGSWRVLNVIARKNVGLVVSGSNLRTSRLDRGFYYGPIGDPEY